MDWAKTMKSFLDWYNEMVIRKTKKKKGKDEQSTGQRSTEVGHEYQQGEADRSDQEIASNNVHYIPEP